ncbi:MAG: FkbM family methyltransferase [Cyclobacteriaceae bacterium]|nr:FkbM family methyltransferase [Cyclobacteriaceae bacterium]
MQRQGFLYRQRQKWNYHFAKNEFEKKVAEINRHELKIDLNTKGKIFNIQGAELNFSINKHAFLIDRFDLFIQLTGVENTFFTIKKDVIIYHIDGLNLRVTTAEELFIIKEIFIEKCYNIIVPEEEIIVIDIGMNVGFASLFFAKLKNVKQVYSFEPFQATFEDALKNFNQNKDLRAKINPSNYGLGKSEGEHFVNFKKDLKGQNRTIITGQDGQIKVKIKACRETIEDILSKHKEDVYLKIDTEGAEYDIFESLFSSTLHSQIKGFFIEWHDLGPASLERQLVREGFKMTSIVLGKNTGLIYAFR